MPPHLDNTFHFPQKATSVRYSVLAATKTDRELPNLIVMQECIICHFLQAPALHSIHTGLTLSRLSFSSSFPISLCHSAAPSGSESPSYEGLMLLCSILRHQGWKSHFKAPLSSPCSLLSPRLGESFLCHVETLFPASENRYIPLQFHHEN